MIYALWPCKGAKLFTCAFFDLDIQLQFSLAFSFQRATSLGQSQAQQIMCRHLSTCMFKMTYCPKNALICSAWLNAYITARLHCSGMRLLPVYFWLYCASQCISEAASTVEHRTHALSVQPDVIPCHHTLYTVSTLSSNPDTNCNQKIPAVVLIHMVSCVSFSRDTPNVQGITQ